MDDRIKASGLALTALTALLIATAPAACAYAPNSAGPSAPSPKPVATTTDALPSDATLLAAIATPTPGQGAAQQRNVTRQVEQRLRELRAELIAAPFSSLSTVPLPGTPAVASGGAVAPPKLDAHKPDRYEPDNSRARAKVLPMGATQSHTLTGSGDTDWIALPSNAGPGVYYIVANHPFVVDEEVVSPGTGLRVVDEIDRTNLALVRPTPTGRVKSLGGYSWLKITTRGDPVAFRIAHVRRPPQGALGEPVRGLRGLVLASFFGAVGGPDAGDYYEVTGRVATRRQLLTLRAALWGAGVRGGTITDYDLNSAQPDSVLRICSSMDDARPSAFWIRMKARAGRGIVTSAGLDGSWQTPAYAEKLSVYLRMRQALHLNSPQPPGPWR